MSSKASTSKKEPKLPTMETIITRHKAAQLKRQLRNKTICIVKLDELSQPSKPSAPTKVTPKPSGNVKTAQKRTADGKFASDSPKKSKDVPKVPEKRLKKHILAQVDSEMNVKDEEYYPDRLKRKKTVKKVLLKPKHELKLIGSKRKKMVPRKGINSLLPSESQTTINQLSPKQSDAPKHRRPPEISVTDLVRLTEETDLNDEDFLEILTCPSPVWWEDPPDSEYFEDAIFTRDATPEVVDRVATPSTGYENLNKANDQPSDVIITEAETKILVTKQTDKKFMEKRTKLDQLLRNIKNRVGGITVQKSLEAKTRDKNCILTNTTDIGPTNSNAHNNIQTDDYNISHNNRAVIKTECSLEDKHTSKVNATEKSETANEKIIENTIVTSKDDTEKNNTNKKINTESAEEPFFTMFNDDLLNDLENMDIPMENDKADDCVIIGDTDPCSSKSSFLASGEYVRKFNPMVRIASRSNKNLSKAINKDEKLVKKNKRDDTEIDKLAKIKELKIDITTHTASNSKFTITSIQKEDMSSPLSMKSQLSDYTYDCDTASSLDNLDTISDSNIRFINDDDSASVSSKCSDKQSETCTSPNDGCEIVSERIDSKSVEFEDGKQFFLERKQDKSINGPIIMKTIAANTEPKNVTTLKTGTVIKLNAKLSNAIKLKPITIRSDLSKIRIISKFKPSSVASQNSNNVLTNINATIADLKPRQTEVPPVLSLNQELPLKELGKPKDPLTANCEKVKDKVDIMSVYKIICKDKFPLNNGPKSKTGNEDNSTSKADVDIYKEENNIAYNHKENGVINTKNEDTNTTIGKSNFKENDNKNVNNAGTKMKNDDSNMNNGDIIVDTNLKNSGANMKNGKTNKNKDNANMKNCETNIKNSEIIIKNVKNGDTNIKTSETNVKNGDTNIKHSETDMKNGEANLKNGDTNIKNGDTNIKKGDTNIKNGEIIIKNVKNGDTNIKTSETNVKNGDTNIKHSETNMKNGETSTKKGDTNIKNRETNMKNVEIIMKNLALFYKKYKNGKRLKNPSEIKTQTINNNVDMTEIQNTKTNEVTEMNLEKNVNVSEKVAKFCDKCDRNTQKSIAVPNSDKVKYCLKCSSIFDTEDCAYCLRKVKSNENGPFVCQTCDMKSCCIGSFDYHRKWHESLGVKT